MTNILLLKSVLVRNGYTNPTKDVSYMLGISKNSASMKMNDLKKFKQDEIETLYHSTDMTDEELVNIFLGGVKGGCCECNSQRSG